MPFKPSKFSSGSKPQQRSADSGSDFGGVEVTRAPSTATLIPGSDVDEEGNTTDFATQQTEGELTGFKDKRNFLERLGDAIQGKGSAAAALNAQLALNRDTTAQQLKNELALVDARGKADTQTQVDVANNAARLDRAKLDYAHQLEASGFEWTPEHQLKAQQQGFNINSPEGRIGYFKHNITQSDLDAAAARSLKEIAAKGDSATATALLMPSSRLGEIGDSAVSRVQENNNADASKSKFMGGVSDKLTTALPLVSPEVWKAGASAYGLDKYASNLQHFRNTLAPDQTTFTAIPGQNLVVESGGTKPDKDPITGLSKPGTGTAPFRKEDRSAEAVSQMNNAASDYGVRFNGTPLGQLGQTKQPSVAPTTAKVTSPESFNNPYTPTYAVDKIANYLYSTFHPLANLSGAATKTTAKPVVTQSAQLGPDEELVNGMIRNKRTGYVRQAQ